MFWCNFTLNFVPRLHNVKLGESLIYYLNTLENKTSQLVKFIIVNYHKISLEIKETTEMKPRIGVANERTSWTLSGPTDPRKNKLQSSYMKG